MTPSASTTARPSGCGDGPQPTRARMSLTRIGNTTAYSAANAASGETTTVLARPSDQVSTSASGPSATIAPTGPGSASISAACESTRNPRRPSAVASCGMPMTPIGGREGETMPVLCARDIRLAPFRRIGLSRGPHQRASTPEGTI